ncbi:TetR family transcriptional regulator, partial [Streptomyces sp. NEAU-H22]|nr:TetR family transcriptional regulator [Streptomyces sp. NEAU-H22]
ESITPRTPPLRDTLVDPDADLVDQVRCASAIFTLHAGMFLLQDMGDDPEEKNKAVLEVATDLVTQAHRGAEGS